MDETLFVENGLHHHPSSAEKAAQTKSGKLLAPQTTRSADKTQQASGGILKPKLSATLLTLEFFPYHTGRKQILGGHGGQRGSSGWSRRRLHLLTDWD